MTIPTEIAALRVVESLLLLLIEKNILPADELLAALDEVVATLRAQGKRIRLISWLSSSDLSNVRSGKGFGPCY